MDKYKAIETRYNGHLFRSRLEARWAVVFDTLGIKYQYELEGFRGVNNTPYLPDFYFPDYDFFGEVKPTDELLFAAQEKISAAIDYMATPVSKGLILLGPLPYQRGQLNNYDIRGCRLYWDKGVCCSGFAIQSVFDEGRILSLRTPGSRTSFPVIPKEASVEIEVNPLDLQSPSLLDYALQTAISARFEFQDAEKQHSNPDLYQYVKTKIPDD